MVTETEHSSCERAHTTMLAHSKFVVGVMNLVPLLMAGDFLTDVQWLQLAARTSFLRNFRFFGNALCYAQEAFRFAEELSNFWQSCALIAFITNKMQSYQLKTQN